MKKSTKKKAVRDEKFPVRRLPARVWTLYEVADMCRLNVATVRKLVASGQLGSIDVSPGNRPMIRVTLAQLAAFETERTKITDTGDTAAGGEPGHKAPTDR